MPCATEACCDGMRAVQQGWTLHQGPHPGLGADAGGARGPRSPTTPQGYMNGVGKWQISDHGAVGRRGHIAGLGVVA